MGGGGGRGRTLDGNYPSPSITLMGIAAGGKISQKIYEDCLSVDLYDEEEVQRLWIHVVSSDAWEVSLFVIQSVTITYRHLRALDYHGCCTTYVSDSSRQ